MLNFGVFQVLGGIKIVSRKILMFGRIYLFLYSYLQRLNGVGLGVYDMSLDLSILYL